MEKSAVNVCGSQFILKGVHLLVYVREKRRSLMLPPDHERSAHYEVRLEN